MCWDPQREGGIENLPSQQMRPPQLSLWASLSAFWLAFGSFYIRHSESSNSEMPKRILVVLEAMDIRGTSCGHLPSLPTSMIHLLGSWASTGNKKKKKKEVFHVVFFFFFLIAEKVLLCNLQYGIESHLYVLLGASEGVCLVRSDHLLSTGGS